MAHGSGGKSSADLMKDIFGKYFSNEVLDKLEDAAVLEINGTIAYSTDSFVVTPAILKAGISENWRSAERSMIWL